MKNKRQLRIGAIFAILIWMTVLVTACGNKQTTTRPLLDQSAETSNEGNVGEADEPEISEPEASVPEIPDEPVLVDKHEYDFTICFAGDISLDENAVTTANLDANAGDISKCISRELIQIMQDADVMCLNNEFTYSTNGTPMEGKAYTFRANPSRVNVLKELGVDVAGLANNHVYDYGKQAILDTFTALEDAGISYVGAGRTLSDAMEPSYIEVDGRTIAIVAASRAEKNVMTPQATETDPGILRCYDTALFMQEIEEARSNADFVIAFVHWGTEYSTVLEDVQLETGKAYLDAGADVVIGAHSHCIQGMEYYNGKPILYSLGNYWFNSKSLDSMLVELHFSGDDEAQSLQVQVIPALQADSSTTIVSDPEKKAQYFENLQNISVNVEFSADGFMSEKTEA